MLLNILYADAVLARTASRCRRAYILPLWLFLSFFLSSFLRRPISDVTERISTKLEHIFTYDCYLKNLVPTFPGIYPSPTGLYGLGGNAFWDGL